MLSILNIAGLCGNTTHQRQKGDITGPWGSPRVLWKLYSIEAKLVNILATGGFLYLRLISYRSKTFPYLAWIQMVVLLDIGHNPTLKTLFLTFSQWQRSQLQTDPIQWRGIWILGTDFSLFEKYSQGIKCLHLKVALILSIHLRIYHLCYFPCI